MSNNPTLEGCDFETNKQNKTVNNFNECKLKQLGGAKA